MEIDFDALEDIALAEINAEQAQKILAPILRAADERAAKKVYTALRAWTWKALNEKRRDAELRAWYQLLRGVSAFFTKKHRDQAYQLQALYELIYESISVSEMLPVQEVLNRTHIASLMKLLFNSSENWVNRATVLDALKVKHPNLSRIMGLALNTGLVERRVSGKNVEYRLTAEGSRHAFRLTLGGSDRKAVAVVHFRKPSVIRGKEPASRKEVIAPPVARPVKHGTLAEKPTFFPRLERVIKPEPHSLKPDNVIETMNLFPAPQKVSQSPVYH